MPQFTPAQLRAVESFDLPPVRVAVLTGVVVVEADCKLGSAITVVDVDTDDVGFAEVQRVLVGALGLVVGGWRVGAIATARSFVLFASETASQSSSARDSHRF
ncbi:MAG: hypothetical protein J07HN6_00558 [Halonotius sp. J07HN6]|nr:MAG: hypothetical protein J07HN6_00558 [Halonotius sp. J07HN6]